MTDTDNPNDEAWDKAIANIEYVYQLNKALTGTTNSALRAAARDILEAPAPSANMHLPDSIGTPPKRTSKR